MRLLFVSDAPFMYRDGEYYTLDFFKDNVLKAFMDVLGAGRVTCLGREADIPEYRRYRVPQHPWLEVIPLARTAAWRLPLIVRRHDAVFARLFSIYGIISVLFSHPGRTVICELIGDPQDALLARLEGRFYGKTAASLIYWLTKRAIARADLSWFVADFLRKKYVAQGKKQFVVASDSRLSLSSIHASPKNLDRQETIVIGYVGRLERVKGIFLLPQIAKELRAAYPQMNFVMRIIGGGSQAQALHHLVRSEGVEQHFEWREWIPYGPALRSELRELTILLLPSFSEGLPLIVLDAMACGVPVVASSVGGIPEIINHGENGMLFSRGDYRSAVACIGRLLYDAELYKRISNAALQTARERTADIEIKKVVSALRECVSR